MNIVIVGTSSGLGLALSRLLAKRNQLLLLSRRGEIYCDVRSPESVKKAFLEVDKRCKKIDVLINSSGIGLEKKLEDSNEQEIEEVIRTNLLGNILCAKEAYSRMLKQKTGHIINISSTSGKKARENETIYCASKWGLSGFSESLRLEAKKYGIRVTTVYPGGMKTNFFKKNPAKDISSFMNPVLVGKQIVSLIESDPSICPSELVIEHF